MCASIYSFLFLFTTTITLITSIFYGETMVTEGLPLVRQERSTNNEDIIAGADFLSLFMKSYNSRTTVKTTTTLEPQLRDSRSTDSILVSTTLPQETTSYNLNSEFTDSNFSVYNININNDNNYNNNNNKTSDNSVIVESKVSVLPSLRTLRDESTESTDVEDTTNLNENIISSEEHPAVVAKSDKSDFSVEESEPITTNSDLTSAEFSREYPANVQSLPRQSNGQYQQPFHQTLIFHNNEPGKARSVSFSSVIQSLPHPQQSQDWQDDEKNHERHERHYDGIQSNFNKNFDENKKNETKQEKTTKLTTEKNWEHPVRRLPTVYGQPEQNYEVDESASIMTNGRVHGVQSVTLKPERNESKKVDDNQKVGYVVEGRNYRKYRVEERTSDGFIVGEYGVVSHDDGSLRGVRYTADGTINPRLIYDALMKFLSL